MMEKSIGGTSRKNYKGNHSKMKLFDIRLVVQNISSSQIVWKISNILPHKVGANNVMLKIYI